MKMNYQVFPNKFFNTNYSGTVTPPGQAQQKAKIPLHPRQQFQPREYSEHFVVQKDKSPIKKQMQGMIVRNESCKHLVIRRRNSNFTQNQRRQYYQTQKAIKNHRIDPKTSAWKPIYQTMKQIQNIDPISNKNSLTPSKKIKRTTKSSFFFQRKLNGDWFDILRLVGKGKYGKVFLVRDKQTGFIMALKVIQKKKIRQSNLLQQLIRQLKIQFYLDHPGIIKLFGFFDNIDNFYLLMQLGCDGQLYDKISDKRLLSQQASSFVARSMLQVVEYMHNQKVLHRDIKPENIVMIMGHLKICDFGWAVYNNTQMRSTFCGTPLYFSPELLSGQQYDEKVDLWAIGVMIFQLVTGVSPFNLKQPKDLHKIVTHQVQFPKSGKVSLQFKSFINRILQKNPQKRPTSKQLLSTSFIKNYKQFQICQQLCKACKSSKKEDQIVKKRSAKSNGKDKFQNQYKKYYY